MEPPPPPLPLPDPTARRHDGFYLRIGLGVGYGHVQSELAADDSFELTYKGYGPSWELLLGGTPGAGVVIGGGILSQDISEPEVEVTSQLEGLEGSDESDDALGMGIIGPFIDWFPDETGGAHVGAMFGVGVIGLREGSSNDDDPSSGWGASLWSGYDFWVANQWALGALARAQYLSTKREMEVSNVEVEDKGWSFQVLFTALHH
jgi:hypothetical protein